MMIFPVIPIRNRPGLFAVLAAEAARAIQDGGMKLYLTPQNTVVAETITRNRRPLDIYDPGYRIVFFALDQSGRMVTETAS